jgi:hypothetical protein
VGRQLWLDLDEAVTALDGTPAAGYSGIREELTVDEQRDGEEEMTSDKKLSGSWDVVAGTATRSTTVVAWLGVSFSPMQGEGGSVQCGGREKKADALLTSSGGRQLCSKAATTSNGRGHGGVAPGAAAGGRQERPVMTRRKEVAGLNLGEQRCRLNATVAVLDMHSNGRRALTRGATRQRFLASK